MQKMSAQNCIGHRHFTLRLKVGSIRYVQNSSWFLNTVGKIHNSNKECNKNATLELNYSSAKNPDELMIYMCTFQLNSMSANTTAYSALNYVHRLPNI